MAAGARPLGTWRNRILGSGEEAPDQLAANPRNWRTHPAAQRKALRGALDTVGWVQQVIVNRRTGNVVDGHARIEEALSRNEPAVPVLYVDLSDEEEALVLATLDPIAAMADADDEKLRALVADVSVDDEGLADLLAELVTPEPRAGLTDPDAVPAPAGEPYVKPGDLYALGEHRLLCGDATDRADVERLLAGTSPTLLVTDPPYGVELHMEWRDAVPGAQGPAGPRTRTEGHRNTSLAGDTRVDWSAAYALVPSLEVGYVWHASLHSVAVAEGLTGLGFELVAQLIWDKGRFAMGRSWYQWRHEPCWVIRRPGLANLFVGERNQATILTAPSPKMVSAGAREEKFDHPAQKPMAVIEPAIANHRGDVYEPFAGSGTTLIAAERLGRRCYAMEIDPRYAQVAIERWEAYTGRTAERLDG